MKRSHILCGKKLLPLLILLLLVLSLLNALSLNMVRVSAGEFPAIYIDPQITEDPTLMPGKNYIISIKTDYNGCDIWGWKFTLTYNPSVLHGGIRKTDTWTSFPNNTSTWTGDNKTRMFYTYTIRHGEEIRLKPVVPDSEEVYVNQTLMTKPANYIIDYPEGKLTFTTAPGLEANVTAIYQHLTFSTTGTPVVPDSEEVYVNQTLMTRIARITEKWIGDGVTRTFYTTQPVFPSTESVLVDGYPPSWWGLEYTIDNSTGKITFDPAPYWGAQIKVVYDNWGNYTVDYSESTITFEIGSQPPDGVEIKATYLYGGVTNGDLITTDKHPKARFTPGTFNNTIGKLSTSGAGFFAYTTPLPTTCGPGTLANVTFTVVSKGISNITLGPETALINNEGGTIIDYTQHGYFDNRPEHDVAVGSVTAPDKAAIGKPMSISVEVANLGKSDEVANVTISYDTTYIDSQNVTLLKGESETVSFSWNTTGVEEDKYTINATATIEDDGDLADNWNTTTIFLVAHDVAVGSVTAPHKAAIGEPVDISVEIANLGAFTETLNVTVSYDATFIGFNDTVELPAKESIIVRFEWNTTGVDEGTYAINATATIIPKNKTDTWNGNGVNTTFTTTGKPVVPDSEKVYVNQTLMTKPANYTIDYETGDITFATAPGVGAKINATYLYPVDGDLADNWNTTTIFLVAHDVAIIGLDAPAEAAVGDPVFINVNVTNIGVYDENVTLTVSHISGGPVPKEIDITTTNITLAKGENKTRSFSWNTTGLDTKYPYTIKATATIPDDDDPTDNSKTTKITLKRHDIKVTYLEPSHPSVFVGGLVNITVKVKNFGGYNETFIVKVTYETLTVNGTIGESLPITLPPGNSTSLSFIWNTTDVDPAPYTIKAEAILAKDAEPKDNVRAYLYVFVNLPLVGTVTDASNGLPIEGASVTAGDYTNTTDAEGHYSITDIPAGTYTVTASKDGYESSSKTDIIVVAGETTTLNFTLTPLPTTGTITGTVMDSSTEDPIAGATVTANNASVSTGTDGSYIIELEPGTYTVTASKDGYESSSKTDIIVVAGNTTQVDFELTPVQPLNILPYVGVAAIAIIIIAAVAIYFLRIRKPKPT